MTEQFMAEHEHCKLYVLGMVGRQYFTKKHMDIAENFPYTVQKPTMHRARLISEEIVRAFLDRELDEVRIFYTEMQSAVAMEPVNMQLLPLKKAEFLPNQAMLADMPQEEIVLSPSADVLLNTMIPNYLTGLIYGCLVEAYASENNARMMAMQSSTDSAKKMLRELSIEYNRARQAAITQEITEIVSGAKSTKKEVTTMNKGKIVQVMGPVVDVVFEDGNLPEIKDALEVENNGKRCVMEVSHHLGNNMVRCIMLSASEGLQRDREVIATGSGIKVPVGDKTLDVYLTYLVIQ